MKSIRDDCILIENSLALWVGGDLEAELRARVDQHLAQCERCELKARSLTRARQALISGLRARDPRDRGAPDLWPNLQEVLRREGHFASARPVIPMTRAVRAVSPGALASNPRNARRLLRFGLAAAAAVLVGFLLGRLGADGAPVDEARSSVAGGSPDSQVIAQTPSPVTPVVPVSDGFQLRRLAPGEPRLSDTAESFGGELYINPSQFGNPNVGSPASLQSVLPRR